MSVVEILLRDGIHVVEAEVAALGEEEIFLPRAPRHDVGDLESVFDDHDAVDARPEEKSEED